MQQTIIEKVLPIPPALSRLFLSIGAAERLSEKALVMQYAPRVALFYATRAVVNRTRFIHGIMALYPETRGRTFDINALNNAVSLHALPAPPPDPGNVKRAKSPIKTAP